MKIWLPHEGAQEQFLQRSEYEVLFGGAAGPGKGLALDTPLPTPLGWTTMGDVQVGDALYDERGRICTVVSKSAKVLRPCFRLEFDDGSAIVADDVHRWSILDKAALSSQTRRQESWRKKRRAARKSRSTGARPYLIELNKERGGKVRDVGEWHGAKVIETSQIDVSGRKPAIPVASIGGQHKDLPIDPYVLGAWLGDGTSASAGITCDERYPWVVEQIEVRGNTVTKWGQVNAYGIDGIAAGLTALNLKKNKHIPRIYLRSSVEQRRDLLAGLIDTDGHVSASDGSVELVTVSGALADGYHELACSLGFKAVLKTKKTTCQTGAVGKAYRVTWTHTGTPVCAPKKAANLPIKNRPVVRRRYIKKVTPIEPVFTQCVAVDSPSNLYLAGRSMIPTHNTDCLISAMLADIHHPDYHGVIFRRTYPQLQEIIDRCHERYPVHGGSWRATDKRWTFPSGAKIDLSHMQHEDDKYNQQGKEYQRAAFDELTQFSETQYLYIVNSRIRTTTAAIVPQAISTTNPGGIGHMWVKERFQPEKRALKPYVDTKTGLSRIFIPATIEDNPTLFENDPAYVSRLESLNPVERMRLRFGIWDAFEGQAFPELTEMVHSCEPFDIPPEWEHYCVMDWGYAKPFCVHWYAIDYDNVLYLYREWYGCKREAGEDESGADRGLKLQAWEVARGILEREENERNHGVSIRRIADPTIWQKRPEFRKKEARSVTIVEDFQDEGVFFLKADNDRIHGRMQVHKRLQYDEEVDELTGEVIAENPQFKAFKTCAGFWRTVPNLAEDERNPEDIDTKQEDHPYDTWRYMCIERPIKPRAKPTVVRGTFQAERKKLIKAKQYAQRHGVSVSTAYQRMR